MKFILILCLFAALSMAQWTRTVRAPKSAPFKARVLLKQQNLDLLEARVLEVSDPDHPDYGQWLTIDEINTMTSPKIEEKIAVAAYLVAKGLEIEEFSDYISIEGTVEQMEEIFDSKLYYYTHPDSPRRLIRGYYTVPEKIENFVDFIAGFMEVPLRSSKPKMITPENNIKAGYVIPEVIRKVYNISMSFPNNKNSSLCLAEFQDDRSYNPDDLKYFAKQIGEPVINVVKHVGPFQPQEPDGESTLDVQYGGAIAGGHDVWFWVVDQWMLEFSQDLYKDQTAPYVVSMSWGWPSNQQCQIIDCSGTTSEEYVTRVNSEFLKITGRGITLFASSGDQGAPGDGFASCSDGLSNLFPADSKWVTAVGATMLTPPTLKDTQSDLVFELGAAPVCSTHKCATTTAESVCSWPDALITTGGGFSSFTDRPSWQDKVVSDYLSNSSIEKPDSKYFNAKGRAFPDISALGHAYLIGIQENMEQVDGTSCSAPVLGGMFTLINSWRFNNNKPPMGFINQLLYKAFADDQSIFHLITKGNNKCTEQCCSKLGFEAGPAWSPVTGLGTPDFGKLVAYIESKGL